MVRMNKLETISEKHDSTVMSASREEKQLKDNLKELELVFPGTVFEPADKSKIDFDFDESSI